MKLPTVRSVRDWSVRWRPADRPGTGRGDGLARVARAGTLTGLVGTVGGGRRIQVQRNLVRLVQLKGRTRVWGAQAVGRLRLVDGEPIVELLRRLLRQVLQAVARRLGEGTLRPLVEELLILLLGLVQLHLRFVDAGQTQRGALEHQRVGCLLLHVLIVLLRLAKFFLGLRPILEQLADALVERLVRQEQMAPQGRRGVRVLLDQSGQLRVAFRAPRAGLQIHVPGIDHVFLRRKDRYFTTSTITATASTAPTAI